MTLFSHCTGTVLRSAVFAIGLWGAGSLAVVAGPVETEIEILVSSATFATADGAGLGARLQADVVIPNFYRQRQYQPAWRDPQAVQGLLQQLAGGTDHGLSPEDFHLSVLSELARAAQSGSPRDIAVFDVVATDAAVTLLHHLIFGKVDPGSLDDDWNFSQLVIESDPATILNQYLEGDGFGALIDRVALDVPQYLQLIDALARYRAIARDGGWQTVPDDVVLKPGMTDAAVEHLRRRLAAEGALNQGIVTASGAGVDNPLWVYDRNLQVDVKAFQTRLGLSADGVVGARTFAALNRPVADRINQIRLSLERARWIMRNLEDEYVLVNIAGARVYLVKTGGSIWTTRAITGSAYRKTPVFRDDIKFMELNPTWTVPNSILRKDKLARIRKDAGYLSRNHYDVRNANGDLIPAASVDWSQANPPVTLVQRPGPDNALGLVKFMFPNKYAVYLHDTNDHSLFSRNERNLSSGCVRLEYPFEFASLLMEGDPDWNRARMQSILDSGKTTRVTLPAPMPVLLTYWTAWVEEGEVHFREDPYGRDGPILQALDR